MRKPCSRLVRTNFQYDKYVSLFASEVMNEVKALMMAVAEAEEKAAAEQALREKHEARVIEAEQELQ